MPTCDVFFFSHTCPGLILISCMRNRKNKNNSHVNQLALLINMAQDEQDHEASATAIFSFENIRENYQN